MVRFNEQNEIIRDDEYAAIIVGLQWKEDIGRSMDELEGLCEAADIQVVGRVEQALERPNTATLIGSGKVQELQELVQSMDVDTVVFNDELSGIQIRNLEEALQVRVIDRTILILDIFAQRAVSKEGKLQVELAQLQYRMPRLTGFGKSLSRLGGGIGTRGPGEKKLETDRRHIAGRIDDIKAELRKISKTRQVQRAKRESSRIPIVALMGYTNSGKSAIMNRLIKMAEEEKGSDEEGKLVKSQDMLFATLDTQHRKISLGNGSEFILIDTVGFVSRLPHSLVEAFKATLEEVKDANLLIHVVDAAYEDRDFQIDVTNRVIKQVGAAGAPMIMVYNKMDIASEKPLDASGHDAVYISAETREGMEQLLQKIKDKIFGERVEAEFLIPYDKGSIASYLRDNAQVESMEYEPEGIRIKGRFDESQWGKYKSYAVQ